MDSSDDELFNASPSYSKSIINTSLNSTTKQTNDLQDSIKEKEDCFIKDISIKVAPLPNEMKINNEKTSTNLIKNRRRKYKWKFGNCKKRRTLKRSLTQQMLQNQKPTTEIIELLENKIDDNAHLYTQSQKIKEKSCVATQQDVQDVQYAQENVENLTLSTFEEQNEKEDLCIDKTYVCARILPYKFHRKMNTAINNTTDIIACYNFSSLSSSMSTEHNSNSGKTYQYYLNSGNRHKFRKLTIQGELDEWKSKRKRSLSISFEELRLRRKRCRRILSESSNDETAFESNMKMIGDDRNKSYSFYERMDQEKSRPNIQISQEARIVLIRLEEMNDMDVIKWRARQNALKIIESQPVEQLDKQKQVTLKANEHQINEITLSDDSCDECNLWETQDIQDLSQKSNTCVEKHCPVKLSNSLNMTKLRKKYKLFKKPKVLIIKLETLKYYSENGKYSATEIDRLTKKYINFVISSTPSSNPRELLFYGLANLQRKNKTDMNVICIEDDETSYSLSDGQSVDKSFKQSDIGGNLIKGTILFQIL